MKRILFFIILIVSFACESNSKSQQQNSTVEKHRQNRSIKLHKANTDTLEAETQKNEFLNAEVTFEIFDNTKSSSNDATYNGFGYDIYVNGKQYVHQPHIPAVSGNNGFKTEEDAEKVATLVVYKIKNNIIPPTINMFELDSLEIK